MTVGRMTPQQIGIYPRLPWGDAKKVTLPSIQQAFPDLEPLESLRKGPMPYCERNRLPRTPPPARSPTGAPFPGPITPPEYVFTPNQCKRRRVSSEREQGVINRGCQVPRPYAPAEKGVSDPQSPSFGIQHFRPWADSSPPSPYYANYSALPLRSPDGINPHERTERRPVLPSLPGFESGVAVDYRCLDRGTKIRDSDECMKESLRRSSLAPNNGYPVDAGGHAYRSPIYPDNYRPPIGPAHLDRTSLSPVYGQYYQDAYHMRTGEFSMGTNGDGKPRKRRGNLPKEVTERLRTWFLAHLGHPYPSEEEKQLLMRETGLQMNQISNWFINARRRQLPSMINNALAEKEAMNGRSADGKTLTSDECKDNDQNQLLIDDQPADQDHDHEGAEGGVYGDPENRSGGHQTPSLKRGSI
ncbi:hypothetical protein F4801DRAFT_370913 [Xylaria longipes]|nr:hypothetical protein F4801DRAFT_370913 [Xylaria longipes]